MTRAGPLSSTGWMTHDPLNFQVVGVAIPKGSTKAFGYYAKNKKTGALLLNTHGKPILLASTSNANPKTKGWQQLVAEAASQAMQALPVAQRGLLRGGARHDGVLSPPPAESAETRDRARQSA